MSRARNARRKHRPLAHTAHFLRERLVDWLGGDSPHKNNYFAAWKKEAAIRALSGVNATMPFEESGAKISHDIGMNIAWAELWTIDAETAAVVQTAAESMPDFKLTPHDLPTPSGFLYFEEPLEITLPDARLSRIRGFHWKTEEIGQRERGQEPQLGMVIWTFDDIEQVEDDVLYFASEMGDPRTFREVQELYTNLRREIDIVPITFGTLSFGRTPWIAIALNEDDTPMTDPDKTVDELGSHNRFFVDAMNLFYDIPTEEIPEGYVPLPKGVVEKDGTDDGRWIVRTPNDMRLLITPDPADRWFAAFLRFVHQELPVVERTEIPRSGLARWRREGFPDGPVTTVRWRKHARTGKDHDTGRGLSYRHTRRGHWRRQWVNMETDDGIIKVQRPTWINATIVGDPSLPLRVRDVVNVVNR
jgi:hypothetical protein